MNWQCFHPSSSNTIQPERTHLEDIWATALAQAVVLTKTALREQIARLLNQPVEQMGHTQWIAHILKRLHLLDESKRKRDTEGMVYAINPIDVRDMMRRYDVECITID